MRAGPHACGPASSLSISEQGEAMHGPHILFAALLAVAATTAWSQGADNKTVSLGVPLSGAQLSDLRGGTDVTVTDTRLDGTTANNAAVNVQTGTNSIAGGAFGQMTGIPVVIQNTGANVLIQNALVLNVRMQ
jgi:hypothetical protein